MYSLLLTVGTLLIFALLAGRVCVILHVPRVTGYILTGLAAGPHTAALIGNNPVLGPADLASLDHVYDLALGIIAFSIGGHFSFGGIKRWGMRIWKISLIEMAASFVLVAAGTMLAGITAAGALFLGCMAVTTAPAATKMVIREHDSEGPLSDMLMDLIVINNLAAIILFSVLVHVLITPDHPISELAYTMLIPVAVGTGTGLAVSIWEQRMQRKIERQALALAAVAVIWGSCELLGVPMMLATLVAGTVVVNSSPHGSRIFKELMEIDYVLYVLFFIIAGAHLNIELLKYMGVVGVAYVILRTAGKFTGATLGTTVARCESSMRKWLGPAMLAQAGLAIGLAGSLASAWGEQGKQIQTVILASVVFFEILGPLLVRLSLVRTGEVTVLSLLSKRAPVGYAESIHLVIEHFRQSMGIPMWRSFNKPSDVQVSHLMRRNVETIKEDLPLDVILQTFGHSRYDRLPVINAEGDLVGVIRYEDVSSVLFDPELGKLVVASDIMTEEFFSVSPDDTIEEAVKILKEHPDATYLIVVDRDEPGKLAGILRHNDLLSVCGSGGA